MFIYGALVEHKDAEARADIDAMLDGREPPTMAREREQPHAEGEPRLDLRRLVDFGYAFGEVAEVDA